VTSAPSAAGDGERVSPLEPNDLYYAHLSLYEHAARLARGLRVLDVGCGTGYGAALLADGGAASVLAIDRDAEAIAFAQRHCSGSGARFRVHDAGRLAELAGDGPFDLVVALNALEHVEGAEAVLAGTARLMTHDGVLVASVPPVTSAAERLAELANPFHLNVWTPDRWRFAMEWCFGDVRLLRHAFIRSDVQPDFRAPAGASSVSSRDFRCEPVSDVDELRGTYSVVIEARHPRSLTGHPARPLPVRSDDRSVTRSPPRLTPLAPDQLAVEPLPLRALSSRAATVVREEGPAALCAHGREWLVWRARRVLARHYLRTGGH
jgi:SAM-dependent methyltransferase